MERGSEGRRAHLRRVLALAGAALVPTRVQAQPDLVEALARVEERNQALMAGRIGAEGWQDAVAVAFAQTAPSEIARAVDVERHRVRAHVGHRGPSIVSLSRSASGHSGPDVSTKLFYFMAGRTNPLHAHEGLVSAQLVLAGRFRFDHYDRVRDEDDALWIRPSFSRELGPGESTSVSDLRDNVHLHHAISDGVLFSVTVSRLRPDSRNRRLMLDIDAAQADSNGDMRVPIIARDAALRCYG